MTNAEAHQSKGTNEFLRIALGVGVSALTAVMLILAFHPYNVWFLAFFALVPMLIAQYRIMPPRWSGLGNAVGVGGWLYVFLTAMFGRSTAGMVVVIQIVVVAMIVMELFTVPGVVRFHRQTGYRWFVAQGVVDWVGVEMIRSFIPPINTHAFIAHTMYTQPWMLRPLAVFSLYGLALLLLLINYALAQGALFLFDKKWRLDDLPPLHPQAVTRWLAVAGAALVVWLGVSAVIGLTAPQDTPTLRVAAIQHNYPAPGHQDTAESQATRLQVLSAQARSAAQQGAQVIVMPELGLGFDPQVAYTAEFKALAAETQAYLFIGYGLADPRGWRNEMVLLTPAGRFLDVYGKNHPTAPGEPPIVTAGVYPIYATPLGRLATLICNDVNWTDTTRRLARQGAQLIAAPTLETAGITLEQIGQSALRAAENRVAVIKTDAAYASAIIAPGGQIVAQRNGSPNGAAFALVADVPLGNGPTLYSLLGDWLGWLALAGFVYFTVLQEIVKRQQTP